MSTAVETVHQGAAQADSLLGFAALGKTALALALIVGLIVLCSWLLRRIGAGRTWAGQPLRVVGSTLLGQRERVVIVEVQGTWLVLGVGAGQINKLHELPAPADSPAAAADGATAAASPRFAERFASALRQRLAPHHDDTPPPQAKP